MLAHGIAIPASATQGGVHKTFDVSSFTLLTFSFQTVLYARKELAAKLRRENDIVSVGVLFFFRMLLNKANCYW